MSFAFGVAIGLSIGVAVTAAAAVVGMLWALGWIAREAGIAGPAEASKGRN